MKRGRPPTLDKDAIVSAVVAHKSEIVNDKGNITSKLDQVWDLLARELNNVITPHALFTLVMNNRYNVRNLLTPPQEPGQEPEHPSISVDEGDSSILESSTASVTEENDDQIVEITFDRAELEALLMTKQYNRAEKDRPQIQFRQYLVLQPGKWQEAITKKLWEACKKKCGFQFKRNKIYNDKLEVLGKCNCGSIFKGSVERLNLKSDLNKMTCAITSGNGSCGKRYLRDPIRREIGKMLCETNKTAEVHRASEANQIMSPNDPEPPHLYTAEALRKAKEAYQTSLTLHKNPVTSIELAQLSSLKYCIHTVCKNPFYVHYWSNYQTNVFRQYSLTEPSSVAIDATGSLVRKILRADGSKSKHIFLYTCVVNSCSSEKFPIAQMLSESHTTSSICHWLTEWIGTGAPPPKEVTCDASKALLLGAIKTFTSCRSIDDYANRCWGTSDLPDCYIRIDVAHYIKTYANFLKITNPRIKKFYLACLGQLILTRNINEAEEVLFSILSIARSETEGVLEDGQPSLCETHKNTMKGILTANALQDLVEDAGNTSKNELEDLGAEPNNWHNWAVGISEKVMRELRDTGDRENAHYLPQFADRLMKDVKWLPLWSCVCRDNFGYGRVPASSAAVEAEFNNIKTRLLANMTLPIRADIFLKKHTDYIDGRLKIISARAAEIQNEATKDMGEIPAGPGSVTRINISKKTECPACAMGNMPTGAHTCVVCGVFVHGIDACSKLLENEEEGYGQKRLCTSCSKVPEKNTIDILNCRAQENWGGLSVEPERKKSRYLQNDFTENEFILHNKIKKIPTLKNGSSLTLKATASASKKVTLCNTCAFDSVSQIFLTAIFDSPEFQDECRQLAETSSFFKMIHDCSSKGITRNTYHLRAESLLSIFPSQEGPHDSVLVKCEVTVGHLCKLLFKGVPSVSEVSSCDEGCAPRHKPFETLSIYPNYLLQGDFNGLVEENFLLSSGGSHCCRKNCRGIETTAPPTAASYIICEVYEDFVIPNNTTREREISTEPSEVEKIRSISKDIETADTTTRLCNIPTEMKLSFMPKPYKLRGIVHWTPPPTLPGLSTRRSDPLRAMGHYTALCFRPDETWVQYDDTRNSGEKIAKDFAAKIQLIIYTV